MLRAISATDPRFSSTGKARCVMLGNGPNWQPSYDQFGEEAAVQVLYFSVETSFADKKS